MRLSTAIDRTSRECPPVAQREYELTELAEFDDTIECMIESIVRFTDSEPAHRGICQTLTFTGH